MIFEKKWLNWKVVGVFSFLAMSFLVAGWLGYRIETKKRHAELREMVGMYGGSVACDKGGYEIEQWLVRRRLAGRSGLFGKTGVEIFGKNIEFERFLENAIGVEISGSPAINDEDLKLIASFGSIRSLELPVSTLGGPQAHIVGQCRNLEYLDLTGVTLTDVGFSHLGNLTRLQGFTFSDSVLSNRSCEVFLKMKRLSHLEIRRTSFTLEGIQLLAKEHRSLREIIISEGVLRNENLEKLTTLNPNLKIILTPADDPFRTLGPEMIFNSQK